MNPQQQDNNAERDSESRVWESAFVCSHLEFSKHMVHQRWLYLHALGRDALRESDFPHHPDTCRGDGKKNKGTKCLSGKEKKHPICMIKSKDVRGVMKKILFFMQPGN